MGLKRTIALSSAFATSGRPVDIPAIVGPQHFALPPHRVAAMTGVRQGSACSWSACGAWSTLSEAFMDGCRSRWQGLMTSRHDWKHGTSHSYDRGIAQFAYLWPVASQGFTPNLPPS